MEAFYNDCFHGVVKCFCPCRTKANMRVEELSLRTGLAKIVCDCQTESGESVRGST